MSFSNRFLIAFFRALTSMLCRIDDAQLAKVPAHGPLILVTNHINLVEIPILYTRLQPRPLTGFAAAYRWENPFLRWLLVTCGAIPLHRGEADHAAMRIALEKLAQSYIFVLAPEGTRSYHGRLQRAHPGAALLALRSGAPMQPLAFYGNEHFGANLRRLHKTDFHIVVGDRFYLDPGDEKVTRKVRHEMIDSVMNKIAALLPAENRGVYADFNAASEKYIRHWD